MTKKIVIIDDEQDVLEIIKATLKTKGYNIHAADNGEDGWRLILQQHPDLIITDLKMPKMSGLELRKRLQAHEELKDIPIIILSGIGKETGKPDEFWRSGLKSDDFISKPFDPLDLLGRVEYIFRRGEYVSSGGTAQKAQTTPASPPEPQVEKTPEKVRTRIKTKKIVIIDDEQDVLEIIKATLKTKGYIIHAADNGENGWRLILQQRPDLIITDLKMPKMSGLELRKRLQAHEELKDIPIIILSGIGKETGKTDEFWRSGLKSDDFISKPFDPLDLLGRVEYIFRRGDYVSSGATAQKVQSAPASPPESQAEKTPEKVVKDFIEAWNTQDFHLEYRSQAEEMTGGIVEEDYVGRRLQCYSDAHGQHHSQKVAKVEESTINRNLGKVVIIREDTQGARTTGKRETYALKKTMNGWKIVSVRSKPL